MINHHFLDVPLNSLGYPSHISNSSISQSQPVLDPVSASLGRAAVMNSRINLRVHVCEHRGALHRHAAAVLVQLKPVTICHN